MLVLQGIGVSRGTGKGRLSFFHQAPVPVPQYTVEDIQDERKRLLKAQEAAIAQLEALVEKCHQEGSREASAVFEAHMLFVKDEYYVNYIESCFAESHCNAEYAVWKAGEQFAAMFAAMDDAYMKARASDIRDVSGRILENLMGGDSKSQMMEEPVILAANELTPSELMGIERHKIRGIVTREGNHYSHTSILARAMGIPAICGLGDSLDLSCHGKLAWVDGDSGCLYLDPDADTCRRLLEKNDREKEQMALLNSVRGQEDITGDGRRIAIHCNMGSLEDVETVLEQDGRGIGLFRSEFLFLAAEDYPDEEEQFRAYRKLAIAMDGKPVVIRTLDVGADKQASYMGIPVEENPALGIRGIRLCLKRPELFQMQLRALYRASVYGNISILFPMITSLWEVRECKRLCREVIEELRSQGIACREDTKLGIMIETPAAVLIAPALAREVDFFSLGTNDLTQYLLACDRQGNGLEKYCDPRHPAVLRAIQMTTDAAHAAGIPIAICGELAADAGLLPTFLEMGIDELSVAPTEVLPLRARLRSL